MSRYNKMKISNQDHDVSYGHDHAIGYFVQIYSPQYDEAVVEYDEFFGWSVNQRATSEQHAVAIELVEDIKAETVFTERLVEPGIDALLIVLDDLLVGDGGDDPKQ